MPEVCKGCRDWQTAGAEYEKSNTEGSRPFWYNSEETDYKVLPSNRSQTAEAKSE